ncbi:hypothetical protein B0H17DRAFT_1199270 [Mycena rosella]|uniref:Uncharacterized protein n=1 Tax=Mycena rosella TaxID=1033263 RepID=A0AAD7GH38_MYCRO|nr:hypothetical protein B0H17DRAFT_1199270 [Mycena rosella]
MTEYDYSEEGRARYAATQKRIAQWAHGTPTLSSLKSPFTPRSSVYSGSDATARPHHGPSRAPSHHPSTHQSHRPSTHHTYRPSQAGTRSQVTSSTVYPSQSISQAPAPSAHRSHASTHRSSSSHHSHHTHHYHSPPPPSTYVVSPPPGHVSRGVIILRQRGQAPSIVYY